MHAVTDTCMHACPGCIYTCYAHTYKNGEKDVFPLYDNFSFKKLQNILSAFRLHLSVCALRELFKTMSFHRERGLNDEDTQFLEQLQSK